MATAIQKTVYSNPSIDYLNHAHDVRGRIINCIAEMEQRIDAYISEYFCANRDKRNELIEVIISTKHLTFQSKAEILQCLLERNGHTTKGEAKKIYGHLVNTIAAKRNVLAHCSLHISAGVVKDFKNDKEKTVYFLKYLNTKKVVAFGKKEVVEMIELTGSVSGLLLMTKSPHYKNP